MKQPFYIGTILKSKVTYFLYTFWNYIFFTVVIRVGDKFFPMAIKKDTVY